LDWLHQTPPRPLKTSPTCHYPRRQVHEGVPAYNQCVSDPPLPGRLKRRRAVLHNVVLENVECKAGAVFEEFEEELDD